MKKKTKKLIWEWTQVIFISSLFPILVLGLIWWVKSQPSCHDILVETENHEYYKIYQVFNSCSKIYEGDRTLYTGDQK